MQAGENLCSRDCQLRKTGPIVRTLRSPEGDLLPLHRKPGLIIKVPEYAHPNNTNVVHGTIAR